MTKKGCLWHTWPGRKSKKTPSVKKTSKNIVCFRIMVESHTALFGFYWRYAQNTEECFRKVFAYYGLISWWPASWIFQEMFRREFIPRYYKIGIARHTDEQREDLSCRDLKALEDIAKSGNDRVSLWGTYSAGDNKGKPENIARSSCVFEKILLCTVLPWNHRSKLCGLHALWSPGTAPLHPHGLPSEEVSSCENKILILLPKE